MRQTVNINVVCICTTSSSQINIHLNLQCRLHILVYGSDNSAQSTTQKHTIGWK